MHHFLDEIHLLEDGLTNYWGYNSIGYFAPHAAYSSTGARGGQVSEFKRMVKAVHAAGLEVILDVVYNHTAEGNQLGPTLSFRGIDNDDYYHLRDGGRYYADYTGCGNTLDVSKPHVLQVVMDSLRYWVEEMHVDGFRFDLASALARSFHDVNMLGNFMTTIQQDPVLRRVKLIAEPWDVGPGGYQVGEFPPLWTEWNDKYRDNIRDFWRGQAGIGELGWRLSGSADLYASEGRRPFASINFVTAHDGFTMRDLVTYDRKHNEANLEGNRDGTDNNRSDNNGVEGETDGSARDRDPPAAAAQPARDPPAVHRRPDDRGRRRVRPHPARQQQRLLPGQRDLLVRLGLGALAVGPEGLRQPAPALPAPAQRLPAALLLRRQAPACRRPEGPRLARARRTRDRRGRTGTPPDSRTLGMFLAGESHGLDDDNRPIRDRSFLVAPARGRRTRGLHAPWRARTATPTD